MGHVPEESVEIAQVFGEVARASARHEGEATTLERIVKLAVEHSPSRSPAGGP